MHFNLPASTIEFLHAGKQLEYEEEDCMAGLLELVPLNQLTLEEIWINNERADDPHHGKYGRYFIPAVSLTRGGNGDFEPEFLLLWLPEEKLFGSWDSDHGVLTVFPGVSWEDIVADPALYINAQWKLEGNEPGEEFRPWPMYEFRLAP